MTSPADPISPIEGRVLLTGACGFIGRHLVARLLRERAQVAVIGRRLERLDDVPDIERAQRLEADLADRDRTVSQIEAFCPTTVLHYASHPDGAESAEQAEACIESNVRGTLHLLEGFRRAIAAGDGKSDGKPVFVYGDSTKVYGNAPAPFTSATPERPSGAYAVTKLAGWGLCQTYGPIWGFSAVALRPTLIYGPGQPMNLIRFVAERVQAGAETIELAGGSQTREPLYVDDAVEATLLTARTGGRLHGVSLNISGGEEFTVADLARRIVRLLGGRTEVVERPEKLRPTEVMRSCCDIVEAADAIGWRPRVTLEEGLRRTIELTPVAQQPLVEGGRQ